MSPFFRYVLLVFAFFYFASEPAIGRLKKVPVGGGTSVITPSATKYKTVKTEKLEAKKVRVKKKRSKVRNELILEMGEASALKSSVLVKKTETVVVLKSEKKRVATMATGEIEVLKASGKDITVVETVVDSLSESSPEHLTVEKRKKKSKWKFWKKKK